MVVTWIEGQQETILSFPRECLVRFEPIYIRIQMLWRRTLLQRGDVDFYKWDNFPDDPSKYNRDE